MQLLAFYLLKVIACSGIMLLYYRLALRNKRFHYYNRFYLLATIAASILLPLLNINWFTISSNNDKAIALMNVIYVQGGDDAGVTQAAKSFTINWQQLPMLLYATVGITLIILLVWRIRKIYLFKKQYSATNMGGFDFINTDLPQAPFSFLQNLFWRDDIDLNETTGRQILQHEITHIQQKHTWDKLCMQVILAVFWINPFYWFIQKELYLLHEFIADEKAIGDNDGAAFANMLLTSQFGKNIFVPAQSFAYSPINRRLFMLTNLAKPKYSYARRLMALPLLATVILLFAFRVQKQEISAPQLLTITEAPASFKVVIDAGHGGDDYGLTGHGLNEKDITLNICKKIETLAPKYNIDAVLTRSDDNDVPREKRMGIVTEQGAGAFVSIHLNNAPVNEGINTYVSKDNKNFAASKLLGSAVMQNLASSHKIEKTLKERKEGIYVLKYSPVPAILVECGVLNTNADIKALTSDEKITVMAEEILQGIALYANHKQDTTGVLPLSTNAGYSPKPDTTLLLTKVLLSPADTLSPGSKVLIIINGKESPWNGLKQLSPDDIESISVLKDKTATDKYGERGANGVIEIITKSKTATNLQLSEVTVTGYPSKEKTRSNDTQLEEVTVTGYPSKEKAKANNSQLDEVVVTGYPSKQDKGLTISDVKLEKPTKLTIKPTNVTLTADSIVWNGGDEIIVTGYGRGMQRAMFPGGDDAWKKYLIKTVNGKIITEKNGPPGKYTATVMFTVDEEGNLSDFKILKDPGYGTGAEAAKIIKQGPKWIPAKQDGKPVKVTQTQNISWTIIEK